LTKSTTFKAVDRVGSNTNQLTGTDLEPVPVAEESDDDRDGPGLSDILPFEITEESEHGRTKRQHQRSNDELLPDADAENDDQKQLGFKTTYEGFSIWGWVLCLLVERKGGPGKKSTGSDAQALMAEWISTQQQQQQQQQDDIG
jgi:hypothetical protein